LLFHGKGLTAGLLAGVAVLLRPEALWLLTASAVLSPRLTPHVTWKTLASTGLGAAAILLPYELYVWRHFGTLVPPHVGINAAAAKEGWLAGRTAIVARWFAAFDKASFWRTSPAAIAALLALVSGKRTRATMLLAALGFTAILLTVLTVPNDGGGQWSPRYLLFAQLPFALVASVGLELVPRRTMQSLTAAIALVACVWLQREAYRELRGTKAIFGQMVDLVASTVPDPRPIATDVWWLDQVAAAVVGDRPVLFAPDDRTGLDIVLRLSRATVPAVTLVRPGTANLPGSWLDGSCYFEENRAVSPGGEIVALQLRHRCQQ
jgi:hypothetical protein